MRKLYVSDMDGTLLSADATLSGYTTGVLNRLIENGLSFTVATARTAASALHILKPLVLNVPMILMNGVLVFDRARDAYIRVAYLDPAAVSGVIRLLAENGMKAFMYEQTEHMSKVWHEVLDTEPMRAFKSEREKKYYKAFTQTDRLSDVPMEHIIYFTSLGVKSHVLSVRDALSQIAGVEAVVYQDVYSDQWFLEVFSASASKKNALLFLKETYGYEYIVGFGDNLNDLPMFEACDYKIAVENAKPEVKSAADELAAVHTKDGVARWLEANGKSVI